MDTEDMKDAITLLEEVVNSNIFDVKKVNIKPEKIIKNRNKKYIQSGGIENKSEEKTSITDTETSENSYVTGDSMTIGHISVPSEIFVVYKKGKKIDTHNSSHYNLAFSNVSRGMKSDNDMDDIVDIPY